MAEVLLIHHAHGLTDGVVAFADELRSAGHSVHVPDLYDGRKFESLEDGISYAQRVGFSEVRRRGVHSADGLPNEIVYAGFSLGVLPAQELAQTRLGARGALFFHACAPASEFGDGWPAQVPVQIHGMQDDEFFAGDGDIDAARHLVAGASDGELFVYPGDRHLFADASLASYDPEAAALLMRRTLEFLAAR